MTDTSHFLGTAPLTFGDTLHPAMTITDQADADAYLDAYTTYILRHDPTLNLEGALDIARQNIGYFAGYYEIATRRRVNRLFKTTHPVFGDTEPTAEEAFKAGMEWAKKKT